MPRDLSVAAIAASIFALLGSFPEPHDGASPAPIHAQPAPAPLLLSWVFGTADAAPLVHTEDASFRWAVFSDTHLDWDLFQGQNTTQLAFSAAGGAMDADGVLVLGDLYGARKSDLDGDRVWDCPLLPNGNVDPDGLRRWDGTCEYPSAYLGQKYRDAVLSWDPTDSKPDIWGTGNHDGTIPQPTIDSLDEVDEWERTWLRQADQQCVVEHGREYTRCDLIVAYGGSSHFYTIISLPDQTSHQDRAVGGRCDFRDYDGLGPLMAGCSAYGWPVGVITPYQLEWVDAELSLADKEGRDVVLMTHHPVPDTVALSSRGTSYLPQCSTGILVQRPPPNPHYPRDADYLPLRTDLDTPIPGDPFTRTPLQVAQEYVGSVLRWYPGQPPDDTWGLDLVRRHPGVVRVWLSGHNHVPVPDLVDTTGRGMVYQDAQSGTAFFAVGAVTRYWLTTSGTGHPMGGALDLGADGTITWNRWSIQSHATGLAGHGCGTPAQLPSTRPAQFVNVPAVVLSPQP